MNSIILAAKLVSPFEFRTKVNGVSATAIAEIKGAKEGDPPSQFRIATHSVNDLQAAPPIAGDYLLIQGSINLDKVDRGAYKEILSTVVFREYWPVTDGVEANAVSMIGRAGRDAETKYFESGSVLSNVPLAVNRKKDVTDWFDLDMWGKTAEIASDFVKKGTMFGITGSLTFQHWIDRNSGQPRSKPVIKVNRLTLLPKSQQNAGGGAVSGGGATGGGYSSWDDDNGF